MKGKAKKARVKIHTYLIFKTKKGIVHSSDSSSTHIHVHANATSVMVDEKGCTVNIFDVGTRKLFINCQEK